MPTAQIYIQEKNYELFRKLENKSQVINSLLTEHFNKTENKKDNSPEIIEEVKRNIEREEKSKKSYEYMDANREEFNEGYKEGKWKTHEEFYDAKHS